MKILSIFVAFSENVNFNLDENSWTPTKIIKKGEAFVQMAKQIEWASGHNECCSAFSRCSFPACDLCERNTFVKHKNEMIMPT